MPLSTGAAKFLLWEHIEMTNTEARELTDAEIEEAVIEACHSDPLSSIPGEYRLTLDEIRAIVAILSAHAAQAPKSAKQRYDELEIEKEEASPVERLRAFCGLAMSVQDWLDVEPFFDAVLAAQAPQLALTDDMVSRFLGWRLPDDFMPDCGISFNPPMHEGKPLSWPTGTNLLHAGQARKMLEHVLAAAPSQPGDVVAGVQYLCDGARFKVSHREDYGYYIGGLPVELSGRWVAFVAAEDNQHMATSAQQDEREGEQS
jgi:hypothetical protein